MDQLITKTLAAAFLAALLIAFALSPAQTQSPLEQRIANRIGSLSIQNDALQAQIEDLKQQVEAAKKECSKEKENAK